MTKSNVYTLYSQSKLREKVVQEQEEIRTPRKLSPKVKVREFFLGTKNRESWLPYQNIEQTPPWIEKSIMTMQSLKVWLNLLLS